MGLELTRVQELHETAWEPQIDFLLMFLVLLGLSFQYLININCHQQLISAVRLLLILNSSLLPPIYFLWEHHIKNLLLKNALLYLFLVAFFNLKFVLSLLKCTLYQEMEVILSPDCKHLFYKIILKLLKMHKTHSSNNET